MFGAEPDPTFSQRPKGVGRAYVSWASSPQARNVMRANRKRDTNPELRLRRQVHKLGLRYQLGRRIAGEPPVMPDLVFAGAKLAVFVDGCFWHGCPDHGVQPRTNIDYWGPKIQKNKARDQRVDRSLQALGWQTVRIWEHEDPVKAAARIRSIVETRTPR